MKTLLLLFLLTEGFVIVVRSRRALSFVTKDALEDGRNGLIRPS